MWIASQFLNLSKQEILIIWKKIFKSMVFTLKCWSCKLQLIIINMFTRLKNKISQGDLFVPITSLRGVIKRKFNLLGGQPLTSCYKKLSWKRSTMQGIFSICCNLYSSFSINIVSISDLEEQKFNLLIGVVALASVLVLVLLIITIVCIKKQYVSLCYLPCISVMLCSSLQN